MIMQNERKLNKIMLGMSGGVDSSAAAIKLLEEGYNVAGVTMILKPEKYLSESEKRNIYKEAEEARKVCDILSIPHFTPDFSKEFSAKLLLFSAESGILIVELVIFSGVDNCSPFLAKSWLTLLFPCALAPLRSFIKVLR